MKSTGYRRFIILSEPRTGSHMLAQALDSSPHIICFREIFNLMDVIQYDVDGYDNYSKPDISLRADDPVRFLRKRIFCDHPQAIQAVGFKFHYSHHVTFKGVFDELTQDRGLAVLHLQRRNQLRTLVSLSLARKTGQWLERRPHHSLIGNAIRAPIRAARLFRNRGLGALGDRKPRVRIEPQELFEFMVQSNLRRDKVVDRFRHQEIHDVIYEEMAVKPDRVFDGAQRFLGLEPVKLQVETKHQNPEPLSALIENYDELREAFRGTPVEPFFE